MVPNKTHSHNSGSALWIFLMLHNERGQNINEKKNFFKNIIAWGNWAIFTYPHNSKNLSIIENCQFYLCHFKKEEKQTCHDTKWVFLLPLKKPAKFVFSKIPFIFLFSVVSVFLWICQNTNKICKKVIF